jgi:hypothetical protein
MLFHVLLYLTLVCSGIALLALLLLRQAVAEHGAAPRLALVKASRWAGLLFLITAVAIAFSGGPESVSLMARSGLTPAWPSAGLPGLPSAGSQESGPGSLAPLGQVGPVDAAGAPSGFQLPGSTGAAVVLSAEVTPGAHPGTPQR